MGTLYVVATPIGNLGDITLRALEVLRRASLIAAEDTRTTRKLLNHYDIHTPLTSYFEHNKIAKLGQILASLEENDVALVSEAGMPGISDPGYELVRAALERGLSVVPVPGPSAAITALAISGLPTDEFVYVGFLPRRPIERRRRLAEIAAERRTIVAFESPHRLVEALRDILAALGERRIAVARELTKLHEEVFRGTVKEALERFTAQTPRGEFCLVIAGATMEARSAPDEELQRQMLALMQKGLSAKDAIARVAHSSGRPKKEVYRLWLETGKR